LGRIDVDEMLDEISSSQLAEWEFYSEQEPFGQPRNDYLLGLLSLIAYNKLRGEDDPPWTLDDILFPKPVPTIKEQIAADLAQIEAWVSAGLVKKAS
jgi:hypothetical protein